MFSHGLKFAVCVCMLREHAQKEFEALIHQPNYPCIAAKAALAKGELEIGIYRGLGTGESAVAFGRDLLKFKDRYFSERAQYLTYAAVFDGVEFEDEEAFEQAMWKELSIIASLPEFSSAPWDPNFSDNPEDKNFCFSLGGHAFFIVGMHPKSSRLSRQFSKPTLVMNLYEQFEALDEETQFYPMVRTNRKKDLAFQGSVNPMVEQHAEMWEAIQFSGKENPKEWKCPFKRLMQAFQ